MRQPKHRRKRLPQGRRVSADVVVGTPLFPDAVSRARWLFDFLRMELDSISIEAWQRLRKEAWGFVDDGESVIEIDNAIGLSNRPATGRGSRRPSRPAGGDSSRHSDCARRPLVAGEGPHTNRHRAVGSRGEEGTQEAAGSAPCSCAITLDIVEAYWPEMRACPWCGAMVPAAGQAEVLLTGVQ